MGNYARIDTSSHWYYPDGTGCHQVEMATKPGEFRDTTLADARKLGLVPSVTNVMNYRAKPFLEKWNKEQVVEAALDMPDNIRHMDRDSQGHWIMAMANEIKETARTFGSAIHNAIEKWIGTGEEPLNPEITPYFAKFMDWRNANVEEVYLSEQTVVGDCYAGQLDMKARIRGRGVCIVDFKTRKRGKATTKAEIARGYGKFSFYDTDGIQLVAYRNAEALSGNGTPPTDNLVSVMIDSKNPTEVEDHGWDNEKLAWMEKEFNAICEAWMASNKYNVRKVISEYRNQTHQNR